MLINGDTGENSSSADFISLLDIANIACGGHIGDEKSMNQAVSLCKIHKVKIAAHPSYRDPKNFGRKSHLSFKKTLSFKQLKKELTCQISSLDKICKKQHIPLEFVKPHGALYNDALISEAVFQIIAETIAQYNSKLVWIFFSSKHNLYFEKKAKKYGLKLLWEAFPDREYYQGKLLDRKEKKAVFQETEQIVERAIQLKTQHSIVDYQKKVIPIKAQTICLHGDNPASVIAASCIRKRF